MVAVFGIAFVELLVVIAVAAGIITGRKGQDAPQSRAVAQTTNIPQREPAPKAATSPKTEAELQADKESRILDGKEDGRVVQRYSDGVISGIGQMVQGKKHGLWYELNRGQETYREAGHYSAGKRTGLWVSALPDKDEVVCTEQWENGVRHGFFVNWSGGKPSMIHEMKRGELRGYQWVFPYDGKAGGWRIATGLGASDPNGEGEPDEPMQSVLLQAISAQAREMKSMTAELGYAWK
jgi:hypothetical protein